MFNPVVKPVTVRVIVVLSLKLETRHLDFKNAFLHDKLNPPASSTLLALSTSIG
jgi:hypothetical protein